MFHRVVAETEASLGDSRSYRHTNGVENHLKCSRTSKWKPANTIRMPIIIVFGMVVVDNHKGSFLVLIIRNGLWFMLRTLA